MVEIRECKLFLGNLFAYEQLSRREKAGKLECSKIIERYLRFQSCPCLSLIKNK